MNDEEIHPALDEMGPRAEDETITVLYQLEYTGPKLAVEQVLEGSIRHLERIYTRHGTVEVRGDILPRGEEK